MEQAIHSWALPLLRCPGDAESLTLQAAALACPKGHRYEVRGGVPRFAGDGYAASFGFEWTRFDRTQLDHEGGRSAARDLAAKAGLSPEDVAGKLVLEAGCGAGRHAVWLAGWGARVLSLDLSAAVDAAARNTAGLDVQVVQADLMRPPVAPESAEVVISIGVLHHTPDARAAFEGLLPLLAPGGRISIWVYSTAEAYPGSELLRRYTTRMDPEKLLRLCRAASKLYPLYRVPGLRTVMQQVLPISHHPDPEWRALDTFDWYSPAHQSKHTYGEVEGWFRDAGLTRVRRLPFPVSVSGVKPARDL